MDELASFGHPNARFLDLRFVEVRRVQGESNEVGSVIQYRVPLAGLGAGLRLTKKVGLETLLYQLDGRLADNGKLIFNVAPTKDGNSRLSIYAAFDYKRGHGFAGRVLWGTARVLFPGFVHDVVWNHALCTIKEQVERKHAYTPTSALLGRSLCVSVPEDPVGGAGARSGRRDLPPVSARSREAGDSDRRSVSP